MPFALSFPDVFLKMCNLKGLLNDAQKCELQRLATDISLFTFLFYLIFFWWAYAGMGVRLSNKRFHFLPSPYPASEQKNKFQRITEKMVIQRSCAEDVRKVIFHNHERSDIYKCSSLKSFQKETQRKSKWLNKVCGDRNTNIKTFTIKFCLD